MRCCVCKKERAGVDVGRGVGGCGGELERGGEGGGGEQREGADSASLRKGLTARRCLALTAAAAACCHYHCCLVLQLQRHQNFLT